MNQYIINETMLQTWRKGCLNPKIPHTDDDTCKKCKYRGKGLRKNCCDFDDNAMEDIFRSHPIQKTREIPLTKGKVALVDDGDYESLNKHKWTALKNYNTFYAKRESGGKTIYMHRVILGTQPGFETDHIDGNGLNNQKYNLRFVSVRENGQNRHQEKTSRFPGVSKFRNKWKSQCLIGKERIYLGLFDTEEEAFAAYKKTVDNVESPYQSEREKVLDRAEQLEKDMKAAFSRKTGEYNPTSIMLVQQYVKELRQTLIRDDN